MAKHRVFKTRVETPQTPAKTSAEVGQDGSRLYRSIDEPIREGLDWAEMWKGPDCGLIYCWEHGRQERFEKPGLAARADAGELVPLDWKGGVREKCNVEKKNGTMNYLATWQGLRVEDLDLALDGEHTRKCTRTGQIVVFSAKMPHDE